MFPNTTSSPTHLTTLRDPLLAYRLQCYNKPHFVDPFDWRSCLVAAANYHISPASNRNRTHAACMVDFALTTGPCYHWISHYKFKSYILNDCKYLHECSPWLILTYIFVAICLNKEKIIIPNIACQCTALVSVCEVLAHVLHVWISCLGY